MIEVIINCSKSFKMRAIDLLLSLAYMYIFKIIIECTCFVSRKFPIVITLEEEPYTMATPDVQSTLNVRCNSLHDEILIT